MIQIAYENNPANQYQSINQSINQSIDRSIKSCTNLDHLQSNNSNTKHQQKQSQIHDHNN
ncbi:hypothetical protein KSS87_017428 [Heliosperma pusillum]|nr:hypothetical protein KSS87_017428 [Heliosperma pusillum]